MSNTRYYHRKNRTIWLLPGLFLVLLFGIILSVSQTQQTNSLQGRASTVTHAVSLQNCDVPSAQLPTSTDEQSLLDQINAYRQQHGLSALVWSPSLIQAAKWMSIDMLSHQSLNHIDSLNRDPSTRLPQCGYTPYVAIGENIASGSKDSASTLLAWKNSPPHNANMLNGTYTEAGLAVASDPATNSYYWTLDLGTRSSVATSQTPTLAVGNCTVNPVGLDQPSEAAVISQINTYRQQHGLLPLTQSPLLDKTAEWMSYDMGSYDDTHHIYLGTGIDSLNRDVRTRLTDCGYTPVNFGENLSKLPVTQPAKIVDVFNQAVQGWIGSSKDNANLLNPNFSEIGIFSVGTFPDSPTQEEAYTVLEFGSSNQSTTTIPTPTSFATPTIPGQPTPTTAVLPTQPLPSSLPTLTPTFGPSPTPVPGFVANPDDMQLYVTISLTGIGSNGNRRPKHLSRYVGVALYDTSNTPIIIGNGYLTYDGSNYFKGIIHLGKVANNTYYIKIISAETLIKIVQPEFQTLDSTRLNALPPVILTQGDLNADNIIDLVDYNIGLACFQDQKCQFKNFIDFNDDGVTDVLDYNLLLQNYWKTNGE